MKPTDYAYSDRPRPPRDVYRVAAEEPHFGTGENTDEDFDVGARFDLFEEDWAEA